MPARVAFAPVRLPEPFDNEQMIKRLLMQSLFHFMMNPDFLKFYIFYN